MCLVSPPLISTSRPRPTFLGMKSMKSPETDGLPQVGALVRDASGRIGRLMAYTRARAWLRPPGGGREWDVEPDTITEIPGWDSAGAGREGAAMDR
jgi:hypothetical protein